MKYFVLVFIIFYSLTTKAQLVGTPYIFSSQQTSPTDLVVDVPSFAFSTRKIRAAYTGFALRIRNASNNSEANVDFDIKNEVSSSSLVTYVVSGSSGQAVGTTSTLNTFIGTSRVYVTTWYDQSGNARNGYQAAAANQPELILNGQNLHAVLNFVGSQNLPVNVAATTLLGATSNNIQGVIGTLLLTTRINGNGNLSSFGFVDGNNVRFQSHLNWSGSTCYFDAGEVCCATIRNFSNSAGENTWKQYTFQRAELAKLARVSGVQQLSGNGNSAAAPNSLFFGVGAAANSISGGHIGPISEFVLYNKALSLSQIAALENNQMAFWNSY